MLYLHQGRRFADSWLFCKMTQKGMTGILWNIHEMFKCLMEQVIFAGSGGTLTSGLSKIKCQGAVIIKQLTRLCNLVFLLGSSAKGTLESHWKTPWLRSECWSSHLMNSQLWFTEWSEFTLSFFTKLWFKISKSKPHNDWNWLILKVYITCRNCTIFYAFS